MNTPKPGRRYVFTGKRDVPWPATKPTGDKRRASPPSQPKPSTPEADQRAAIDQAFERLYERLDKEGNQL